MPYEILLQHVSIVPCLCVFGISHFGLYYLYSSTKAKYIRFYQNDINATGTYEIEPLKGIIKSRELVSKKQLDDLLTETGSNDGKERTADFYYVLKVEIVSCTEPKISCNNSDLNSVNGNDTFSPHSPKVVTEKWLEEIRS